MPPALGALVAAVGSIGHAWAFALAPSWAATRRGLLAGWRAHVLVVIVSFAGLGIVQWGSGLLLSGTRPLPTSCYAVEPARVCAAHVADILPPRDEAGLHAAPAAQRLTAPPGDRR
jgi:hypothetical protein